jgi:hypothetical protein
MFGAATLLSLVYLAPPEPPGIEWAEDESEFFESEPERETESEPEPEPESESEPEREYHDFIEQPIAKPGARHRRRAQRLPPIYGPVMFSAGIGAGPNSFGFGAGMTRFVVPWVGIGLDFDETIIFDSPAFNDFAIAAHVWFVLLPHRRVTPYVRGGLGPEFFSGPADVYGLWRGGTGLIIRLGKAQQFALRLGADAVGRIPDQRFSRSFTCGLFDSPCSFRIRPEIGLLFNFGEVE